MTKTQITGISGCISSALVAVAIMLVVGTGSLKAQDPTPYITIGDISVYASTDTIVGDCIQGVVSFDAETYTLTLQDATITSSVWAIRGQDFKIKLLGENAMLSLLISPGYSTFIGPGSLVLGGPSVISAISCPRTYRLTLTEGATLEISASECGIDAMYDHMMDPDPRFPDLVVDNSSLIITAPSCLRMMKALWLSECHVVTPSDFQYQLNTWIPLTTWFENYLEIRAGTVGIPDFSADALNISVYPNPTDDVLFIELRGGAEIANVALYDLQGRMVGANNHSPLQGGTTTITMKSIPAGVYVLRVTDADGKEYHQKIVRK